MTWSRATLHNVMGDCVVYRNLEPMREGLDGLRARWREAGLDHYGIPRKTTPEYARVLLLFLRQAQADRGVSRPLARVLFVGDTLMLDGTAAHNMGEHLPMRGFIGAERCDRPACVETQGSLLVANRWGALADFMRWAEDEGLPCDEQTALLLDVDKTSIGARGRNDKIIDGARVQAVQRTMHDALGGRFDLAAFRAIYDPLVQPKYHVFTADNQDYVAYVCLMAVGGIYPAEDLWSDLERGALTNIGQFVERCDARRGAMAHGLLAAHDEVRSGILREDPTPYKEFRRGEYLETVSRMDTLPDEADAEQVLGGEIVITAEVASLAAELGRRGVLVFGISDKPDEASTPTAEQAAQGYLPLHRTVMKVYGDSVV
ncbi:MAG: hypothetical protein ACYC5M_16710 [Anaerolineae bacterium]